MAKTRPLKPDPNVWHRCAPGRCRCRAPKPREIRAALHSEYRDEFSRDYQEALNETGRTLDLEGIY